ncbi:MAG TPA: phosphate ABC transporter substrate-binding protein PstS [Gemmatimonadaceae bacterium]|nr:phosphate ABC transporter substrate-binding protein PstS [Gemmatimonadaceae bacterium]
MRLHARLRSSRRAAVGLLATSAFLACAGSDGGSDSGAATAGRRSGSADLTGAGATFPYPLYSKWFSDYAARTGVRINYQSIGSGGGVRQISEGTVDFGASDAPMSDEEMARAKGGPIVHVPTVIGAVAVTYNLPDVTAPVRLTGEALADIFRGRITRWNDARIAAVNPGATLPNRDILVVHRSDGSGTTYVFTDYLTSVSQAWAAGPGKGKDVQWPTGLGGKGNEGVAGQVKQTPGSIGYVELAYAKQNRLPVAEIRNAEGRFVAPSIESATAAAAGMAGSLPADTDFRVSIVNPRGTNAYPIASLTWLLVYQNQTDSTKGRKLVDFIRWALTEGEKTAAALDYAPLPAAIVTRLNARVAQIKVGAGA